MACNSGGGGTAALQEGIALGRSHGDTRPRSRRPSDLHAAWADTLIAQRAAWPG